MRRSLFGATVFLGAFLVFQIQPLIGKYILPWYGGAAAVWTTCLLVFQSLLFAGYAYAHALAHAGRRTQVIVHLTLLAGAALLPILPGETWKPAGDEDPILRIVLMLTATLGLPYFVLAANGPLLQSWYWRVLPGRSPYPLYALSNAGSLLALLSYPVAVEPWLASSSQAGLWRAVFTGFALLSLALGALVWRTPESAERAEELPLAEASRPGLGRRLLWVGWSACGVILFMAVTNQLTLNVASIPFLWVLPLSIYLLAFVLAFSGERAYARRLFGFLLVATLLVLIVVIELDVRLEEVESTLRLPIPAKIAIYAVSLLVLCMVSHGELFRLRPDPRHLTAYYLSISFGGALGGITVGVIAPNLFLLYQELLLGLVLCCVLYIGVRLKDPGSVLALARGRLAPALAGAGVLALIGVSTHQTLTLLDGAISTRRNFFGLLRVKEFAPEDPNSHAFQLYDGAIVHGYQLARPDLRREPTTYFSRVTGVGRMLRLRQQEGYQKIGIVGLGVGTLAAYGRAGDSFRFYEINPNVVDVAREDFHYLEDCPSPLEIVLGDARLQLAREPDQGFDVLVLDAFSSDSIPVHLLTLEAFDLYERHLAPGGVIAINVSNLHVDLSSVVYRIAEVHELYVLQARNTLDSRTFTLPAEWMVLSHDADFMNHLLRELEPFQQSGELRLRNKPRPAQENVLAWTDERSSLLGILR